MACRTKSFYICQNFTSILKRQKPAQTLVETGLFSQRFIKKKSCQSCHWLHNGPGKGHGWTDITTAQMMKEMEGATGGPKE
jgi:hypothetical protein